MNPRVDRRLLDLAQRVLDGNEIDWEREFEQMPGEAEALSGLRQLALLAEAHGNAARVTPTGGGLVVEAGPAAVRWGSLQLLEKIGEGSYGEVYRALDPRLEIEVALKLFRRPSDPTDWQLTEARSLARLRHPNVLHVYGVDEHEGRVGMWSELLRGRTLEQILSRQGPFGPRETAIIGIDLCGALAAVHEAGLVHGDIKTSNVVREPGGRIVLTDFGTATPPDRRGETTGTPIMAAAEHLQGGPATRSSDLYALGVLLYRLSTNRYPIEAASIDELREAHRAGTAVPLRDRRADLPARFVQAVERATAARPEDRYPSIGEMERALMASLTETEGLPGPAGASEHQPPPRGPAIEVQPTRRWLARKRSVAAALSAAALLALGLTVLIATQKPRAHPIGRNWILVADFEGPPGDSSLAPATRELVSAALEQSKAVSVVPRDQIRIALERAGRQADTHVDVALARELAYRGAVGSVAEGRVSRLGKGYLAVVRILEAEGGRVIRSETAFAKNEDALIPALGRLAEKLRVGLGEDPGAIQAGLPIEAATTPSFNAFRLYARAFHLELSFRHREAIPLLRSALALDPDFAKAWAVLAYGFANVLQEDSALAATNEALRRPGRLTVVERRTVEGDRAILSGDPQAALAAYDRALEDDPVSVIPLVNSSVALYQLGRHQESLERIQLSERSSPYGATETQQWDEARALICLGRVEEARRAARLIPGFMGGSFRTQVEIAAGDWATAESIASTLARDTQANRQQQAQNLLRLASAQASRGALRTATETYDRAGALGLQPQAYLDRLMLSLVTERAIPLPADRWEENKSTAMVLSRGLGATLRGERLRAKRLRNAARPDLDRFPDVRSLATLLEAQMESQMGRWDDVVRTLRPVASSPVSITLIGHPPSLSAVRWCLAEAFEHLDHPDSAAACLETVISDPGPAFQEASIRGVILPFAHRRLALLYARMGRVEEARRHWRIFTQMLRTPDPELQSLIADAQSGLAAAEPVAKSSSR